jgi:pantetheine-phosphate adenylyltransferase
VPGGRTAVYAGTFDPVTHGHLDVLRRAAALFDRLVVSVSASGRATHFTAQERVDLIRPLVADLPNVVVEAFEGLVVDQARRHGARVLVRGLRGARDLDSEGEMGWANACLEPGVETLFLLASPATARISSTLVREVAALGRDVGAWVPPRVAAALRERPPARRAR